VLALIIVVHILVCFLLTVVILLQSGKGQGLAGVFGAGGSMGAVFGGRGAATFLSKLTIVLAIIFMLSCLTQSLLWRTRKSPKSLVQREAEQVETVSPAELLPKVPSESKELTFPPTKEGTSEKQSK